MSGLTRRRLMVGAGAGLVGLSGAVRSLQALADAPPAAAQSLSPAEDVRATMAAIADTIVPGPAGGADELPGAVEAGAVDELYEPFYGTAEAYPLLHTDIQAQTPRILGRPARFDLSLPYEDRERVLRELMTEHPAGGSHPAATGYAAVAVLVYLATYGVARSPVVLDAIGFPPASDGYHPGHSHRVRFRGMTKDGNPR